MTSVSAIDAGYSFSAALKTNGVVVCWGDNTSGQLSVPVAAQSGVVAISAGESFCAALKSDGSVVAWGSNGSGETNVPAAAQSNVISIGAGNEHVVARRSDGTVVIWGRGFFGQAIIPPVVNGNVTEIAVGPYMTFLRVTPPPVPTLAEAMSSAGLVGSNAQPLAEPYADGVPNLLKYAFNMNLSGPDSQTLTSGVGNSGLPAIGLTGIGSATMIRIEFLRRKGSGLVYTPKRSSTLAPDSFLPMGVTPVVTSINDNWERVVVQESANPATLPVSFAIVEVSLL